MDNDIKAWLYDILNPSAAGLRPVLKTVRLQAL